MTSSKTRPVVVVVVRWAVGLWAVLLAGWGPGAGAADGPAAAAEPAPALRLEATLQGKSPAAAAADVVIAVRVSCTAGSHAFMIGSAPQVFGVYVLGPWGPVGPDPAKVRPENWMHQEHSAARRVVITPDRPFEMSLKLADFFPVADAAAFRPGLYQVNVKFYDAGLGLGRPLDSGPVTFHLGGADK